MAQAAALPWYTDHRGTGTAHTAPQAAALWSCATDPHRNTHSEPQQWLPAKMYYAKETASAVTDSTRCGYMVMRVHTHHRTGTPTAGTHSPTDTLSDGYRHNVPSAWSGQPQRLQMAQAAALPWYTDHRGTGTAHTAPQAAALCYASAYTYPQEHPQGHTDPHRAQAAALWSCATDPHRNTHSEPQQWLPAKMYYAKETASAVTDSTRCGYMVMRVHTHHRTGTPTAGTHSPTDSLSDGYRHNVPSAWSASLSGYRWHRLRLYTMTAGHIPTGARIPIGHRNGYSAPQPLPWYTDHRGTGTAHTAPQAAALCYASAYTYPQEHPQGHTDPHRAQAAALYHVCAYIYPQERLQTPSAGTRTPTDTLSGHRWHVLRLYGHAPTIGHTNTHRQPQQWLPIQCTMRARQTASAGHR